MDPIGFLIHLIVLCLVLGLLWWALVAVSGLLPAPGGNIVRVVGTVVLVLIAVAWLLGDIGVFGGSGFGYRRRW